MRRIPLFVITILLLPILVSFGDELKYGEGFDSPFGFMPAEFDFEHAKEAGGYWDRPFFELFEWGIIEPEKERFDFYMTDRYIRKAQRYGFHILANIQPFAPRDQELCHQDLPAIRSPMGFQTKGKPCNMERYKNFVIKLVERYDGDGKDDMPGLKYPIKYWEVANEPEMQREPLVFFQGSPEDYFEILKATHEAVKKADSQAQVVQGGMAGMEDWMVSFWQKVFDLGAASYFDIANMHSIAHGEHLNILCRKDGMNVKPVFGDLNNDHQAFNNLLSPCLKASVRLLCYSFTFPE